MEESNASFDDMNFGYETWDFRFGFKSGEKPEEDPLRSIIGMRIGTKSLTDISDAVLALSIAGKHVEALVADHLRNKSSSDDIRRISGEIQIEADRTVTVSLSNFREGDPKKVIKIAPAEYLADPAGDQVQ